MISPFVNNNLSNVMTFLFFSGTVHEMPNTITEAGVQQKQISKSSNDFFGITFDEQTKLSL